MLNLLDNDQNCHFVRAGYLSATKGDLCIVHKESMAFCCSDVSCKIYSKDSSVNTFGQSLLNVCHICTLHIMNGCCKGNTTEEFMLISNLGSNVDYVVTSCSLVQNFNWADSVIIGSRVEAYDMPQQFSFSVSKLDKLHTGVFFTGVLVWNNDSNDNIA